VDKHSSGNNQIKRLRCREMDIEDFTTVFFSINTDLKTSGNLTMEKTVIKFCETAIELNCHLGLENSCNSSTTFT